MGKLSQALGIEISSTPACHVVFYYSSGWESRGFFPHGKSSRLTTGDLLGTLTTGKPNQGVGRFGGLLGVSATPTTRRVLVIGAGTLSRNAERTLIRRLKPAASPALMERGAARTRRENRPTGDRRAKGAMGWLRMIWAITKTRRKFGCFGVCPPVKTGGFPAVGGRRGLRPLGKIPRLASPRLYFTRSGIAGRFSLRETLSINGRR